MQWRWNYKSLWAGFVFTISRIWAVQQGILHRFLHSTVWKRVFKLSTDRAIPMAWWFEHAKTCLLTWLHRREFTWWFDWNRMPSVASDNGMVTSVTLLKMAWCLRWLTDNGMVSSVTLLTMAWWPVRWLYRHWHGDFGDFTENGMVYSVTYRQWHGEVTLHTLTWWLRWLYRKWHGVFGDLQTMAWWLRLLYWQWHSDRWLYRHWHSDFGDFTDNGMVTSVNLQTLTWWLWWLYRQRHDDFGDLIVLIRQQPIYHNC